MINVDMNNCNKNYFVSISDTSSPKNLPELKTTTTELNITVIPNMSQKDSTSGKHKARRIIPCGKYFMKECAMWT